MLFVFARKAQKYVLLGLPIPKKIIGGSIDLSAPRL
jgi:hypothetical protein